MKTELSVNAKKIFKDLYCLQDESIDDAFKRVSNEFGEDEYSKNVAYELLKGHVWRPNTPVWLNAGGKYRIYSACFPKGTTIRTSKGLLNIEDIRKNDKVLTHNGKFEIVNDIMARNYNGYLYNIDAVGIPNGILSSTDEHPYYIIDKSEIVCKRNKECKCVPNVYYKSCFKRKNYYKNDCDGKDKLINIDWKQAKDIEKGDYITISYDDVVENIDYIDIADYIDKDKYTVTEDEIYYQSNNRIKRFIKIDKDLMLLFGYYLAEGSSGVKGGDIRFTFSLLKDNEMSYCEDVKRILTDKFGLNNVRIVESNRTNTRVVRKESIIMGHFLRNFFGNSSTTKIIPDILVNISPELQRQMLIGVFRGDGFFTNRQNVGIALANFKLTHQIWEILMRCGMFFPMNYQYFSNNSNWNHTQAYRLETPGHRVKKFVEEIWPFENVKEKKNSISSNYFKIGKYWATKITKIEQIKFDNTVYNFEVDKDNTYTVMNVNVHNCFVVGLEDSMDGIYDVANTARKIFQFGSGVGIPIGNLRERNADIFEGDRDSVPEGKSSGPVTFMKLYDAVGSSTKSGGRVRRAAILCTMPVSHPDVMEFIKCKETDGNLENMNISVAFTDEYMSALEDGIPYNLYSPSDGKNVGSMDAQELWDSLSYMAWKTADPGVLFIDTINKYNVLKKKFLIECPNPCVTGDTLVSTDKGVIRIDEMKGDEKVLTYNIEDGIIETEDITFVGKTKIDVDIISIETEDGGILKLTPDHKVYTENRGYVIASDLNEEDILLTVE